MRRFILNMIIIMFVLESFISIESVKADDIKDVFVDDNYDSNTLGWMVDHFSKIQDAINATEASDTVFVYNGTYCEHIILDKSIVLVGEDRNSTIIDGEGFGNTIGVIVDNVSISEFTIRNSGVESNNSGIMVLSDDNIIYDSIVINNSVGIILQGCSNNIITDNFAFNNVFGIGLHNCPKENSIFENYVYNNNVTGIYLTFSLNNTVYNNYVENNGYGIALSYSEEINIFNNILDSNKNDGFNLFFCNNSDFIQNTISNSEYGIKSTSSNSNSIVKNYMYNNSLRGINLVIGSCKNEVYDNTIMSSDTGVYISIDSFDNTLYGNLFSNNNQKLVDELITTEHYSSPGFELIIIIAAILFIYSKKNS